MDGSYLGVFANYAFGNSIATIEVDSSGNVYLAGQGGAVDGVRFNASGAITATYSRSDVGFAYGIDADSDGTTFIRQKNSLYKFAREWRVRFSFNLPEASSARDGDIAIDDARHILSLATSAPQAASGSTTYRAARRCS